MHTVSREDLNMDLKYLYYTHTLTFIDYTTSYKLQRYISTEAIDLELTYFRGDLLLSIRNYLIVLTRLWISHCRFLSREL